MEILEAPISSCSRENQQIYFDWFTCADADGDGRITGVDAIKFFAMSKLSRAELKQVWAIADSKRQGYLDFREFIAAMQLVTLAQAGHGITQEILSSEVDLENLKPPVMEGLDALLAKNKPSPKKREPELDAIAQPPPPQTIKWFSSKSSKKVPLNSVTSIIDGLKRLYIEKLKPLEVTYRFNDFVSPLLTNSDFDAKPMVMLLGQYSTGKTTFIKHLLRSTYPGAHIGPEPTTDRFVVVMVQKEFHLPIGDFPNAEHFKEVLSGYSIDKFEKLKPKMVEAIDNMLGYDIPKLLKNFRNPYG